MDVQTIFEEGDVVLTSTGKRGRVVVVKGKLVKVWVFSLNRTQIFSENELRMSR
jgi:hypothetical protein